MGKLSEQQFVDYARDDAGNIVTRVVEVPYRPEFITFLAADGTGAPAVEWAEASTVENLTGEYRGEAPKALSMFLFLIDPRVCARYGFLTWDVQHVELPTLDYRMPGDLLMRVHVRVRKDGA